MASTSETAGDKTDTLTENTLNPSDDDDTTSYTTADDDGAGDAEHKALNDDGDDAEGASEQDKDIPSSDEKAKSDETKGQEELEKRREREAAFSEEELSNFREESRKLKSQGNDQFGQGFWYEAAQFYTKALDICPLIYTCDRAIYLSNRAAAYMKLSDWEKAIKDCSEALDIGAPNEKPLERRAHCYAQLEDKYERAVEDYESLLKMHPERNRIYGEKIINLKRAIDERNERMKQEMISKLKDLGNMCLKPFGLSTDNFELKQQPGGGYSIRCFRAGNPINRPCF